MKCKKDLGEKCPRCGSTDVTLRPYGVGFHSHYACAACDDRFLPGEGGLSSGLCEPCAERELRHLRGRLTAEDIIANAMRKGSR